MRRTRSRRIVWVVAGALAVTIASFLAIGLILEDSWPAQLLQGAGVAGAREPVVFPSDSIDSEPSIPTGQGLFSSPGGEGLVGGIMGTQVTFQGLWGGYCKVWGTDPAHPSGAKYYSGLLKMLVEGSSVQAYCIDLQYKIKTGDTYQANVYVSAEPELCPVYWILANYSPDRPTRGLTSAEEGAAIQAALWHYVGGFQPLWDAAYWCGKQVVYDRTQAIIAAARGQCVNIPASLDLAAEAQELRPGQTAGLIASVRDQLGQPFPGQEVAFSTTFGILGMPVGFTTALGSVRNTLLSDRQGEASVTANVSGHHNFAVVDPADEPKQRVMIVKPIPYIVEDRLEIVWKAKPAVSLKYFVAQRQSVTLAGQTGDVTLRWETDSETGNQGFNVYRGLGENGPWTRLNGDLIASRVPPGSSGGASYEWFDSPPRLRGPAFYLLEDVSIDGTTTRHGPVSP